jgi:hypothetical protein
MWVRKFLALSNKDEDLGSDLRVKSFINHPKSQTEVADWQVRQVEEEGVKAFSENHPYN